MDYLLIERFIYFLIVLSSGGLDFMTLRGHGPPTAP